MPYWGGWSPDGADAANTAPAILTFKRFLAIGCTHGELLDRDAFDCVLGFSSRWKPDAKVHLGDVHDYAAFRSGAKGTADEARQLGPDIDAGVTMVQEFAPTHVLLGNHDIRAWKLADHPNALIARAAQASRNEFLTAIERGKANLVDDYHINRSWITLGDTKFLHGFMYNVNAIRDHAEHFGKCVIAHLHRAGFEPARRSDHAVGYCVGTLANIDAMDYAATRRATAAWSHGFVWGEYNDNECHINLCHAPQGQVGAWRMPF